MRLMIEAVKGSRIRGEEHCWAWTRLMPRSNIFIWGECREGARQPGSARTRMCRSAAR